MSSSKERESRTVELDREQLKKLLEPEVSLPPSASPEVVIAAGSSPHAPEVARTKTLHDPMTMALLAEVARDSRTVEMDPATIAAAMAAADPDSPPFDDTESVHPHLKRRG